MSIEPWNTGAGGTAVCEDMPRKSIDIRLTEHPLQQLSSRKGGKCALFMPSGEDGFGQSPILGQGAQNIQWMFALRRPKRSVEGPLRVLRAAP